MLCELNEFCLSNAKHNKKSIEAKPVELCRALGLTASDLLFFNVKQSTINKRAIENGLPQPVRTLQQFTYTNYVYAALA